MQSWFIVFSLVGRTDILRMYLNMYYCIDWKEHSQTSFVFFDWLLLAMGFIYYLHFLLFLWFGSEIFNMYVVAFYISIFCYWPILFFKKIPCRRIVHTVGPKYAVKYHTAAENALSHCYRSCLELLIDNGLRRFPPPPKWYIIFFL